MVSAAGNRSVRLKRKLFAKSGESKLKDNLVRLLCSPSLGKALSLVFPNGIPNRGCAIHPNSVLLNNYMKALLFWRLYEDSEVRFVKTYLRSDLDVIELGAGLGVTTSHIARQLGPRSRIICVEADARLIPEIRKNVSWNAPFADLIVVNKAICYATEKGEKANFNASPYFLESRILLDPDLDLHTIRVPTVTLSQLISEFDVDKYALVCDIEGSEISLLQEDQAGLSACQQLVIEMHECTYRGRLHRVSEMIDLLVNKLGFKLCHRRNTVMEFSR